MRIAMCLATCLSISSSGCVAAAVPPAHLRFGVGRTTSAVKREHDGGKIERTTDAGEFAIGMDSTAFAELPFSIEAGLVSDFPYFFGTYLEGGYLRRLLPNLRVGATGGGEYWWGDNRGFGVRAGLTLEYVARFRQGTETETHSDNSVSHTAQTGTPGIGLFLDGGYREVAEKYGYVVVGLSIRWPALAILLDLTPAH